MKPTKDQHVKCVLKNNAVIEGIVDEWSEHNVVLKSLDDKSIMIIHAGTADIVFTKVILEENDFCKLNTENIPTVLAEKVKEVIEIPPEETELKEKSVKELIALRKEQERRIIQDKLKDHTSNGVRTVQYGTPRFFSKQQPK
jgi:hypothetical protein